MAELFKTAPREVVDYFDRRSVRVSWRWKDLAAHEHALAFTVARTTSLDVVAAIRAAVREAVVDRVSFEDFAKGLIPTLQEKGWWGRKVVENPDGAKEIAQLGSVRRLRVIYWANVASAHAAGEWARTQATKDVLPFLQYKVSLSERKRPEHLGWVGVTLPVDHPWWRTHYPPNGWLCKCRVEQMGDLRAGKAPPEKRRAPPLNPRVWRDKRTGKVWRVPEGVDPGWQRNPGVTREIAAAAERRRAIRAAAKPDAPPAARIEAARTIVRQMLATPEFRAIGGNLAGKPWPWPASPDEANRAWQRLRAPVAVLPEAAAERLGAQAGAVVELTGHDAPKMAVKHNVAVEDYELAQQVLDAPELQRRRGGKFEFYRRIAGRNWIAVLKVTREGEVFLNSFHGHITDNRMERVRRELAEAAPAGELVRNLRADQADDI